MTQLQLKYNPGFNDDADLIQLFLVRRRCLDFILRTIDENTGPSNQHLLIVGPRGSGKTTLVRRVASELRTNRKYGGWFPVIFAEESYEVSTPGEFWLEALFRLSDQTKLDRWCKAYEEIKLETDDVRVRERALAQLLDFATEQGQRILLIVENLNMLLGDQLSDHDAWDLRHTFVNEPRIMMLGTAVTRFSEINNSGKPWFELLAVHTLDPLTTKECAVLWKALTGRSTPLAQVRPIQILTGGNPRLIRILAEFANRDSFRDLMNDLVHLIDEHTEYFKSQLDTLPAFERKVFVALLDIWEPATANTVAQNARMHVSTTSAYLNRLVSRGAVSLVKASAKKKLYQSAERLYNIYYLMRKRGHPSNRVRAAVRFMVQFYQGTELVESATRLAREACRLAPRQRADHFTAYEGIAHSCSQDLLQKIVDATPQEFFDSADAPRSVRELAKLTEPRQAFRSGTEPELPHSHSEIVEALIFTGQDLQRKKGASPEAERRFRKAIELDPQNGHAWAHLGFLLYQEAKRPTEGRDALERAVQLSPQDYWAWIHLGKVCALLGSTEKAQEAYRKAMELWPRDPEALLSLGDMLHDSHRYEESEEVFKEVLQRAKGNKVAHAWAGLGELYHYHLCRYQKAEEAYRSSIDIKPGGFALQELGHLLSNHLGRPSEAPEYYRRAEAFYRKRTGKHPKDAGAWKHLAEILQTSGSRNREAEMAFQRVIDLQGPKSTAWPSLLETRLALGEEIGSIVEQAQKLVNANERNTTLLNTLAWKFFESGRRDALAPAESFAREAVERNDKGNWDVVHTFASILAKQDKWLHALAISAPLFEAAADTELAVQYATEFAVSAASAGFASEVLKIIVESKGKPAFEPLEVGLRRFLKESPLAAQEISEVANDIVEQIHQRKAAKNS